MLDSILAPIAAWIVAVISAAGYAGVAGLMAVAVRAALQQVPENTIKFVVGAMIVLFGTYWTMEEIGGEGIWPYSDWMLLILGAFYLIAGLAIGAVMRRQALGRTA